MAYKIINKEYCACVDDYRLTIIADTDDDIKNIPSCCVGSIAIVADGGIEYMTNTAGKWCLKSGAKSESEDALAGVWTLKEFFEPVEEEWAYDVNLQFEGRECVRLTSYYDESEGSYLVCAFPPDGGYFTVFYHGMRGGTATLIITSKLSEVENGDGLLQWLKNAATKVII